MAHDCWDCRNTVLKMKVLVPQNQTIRDYVHQTSNLLSETVAVARENQGQYTVWFRSNGAMKLVSIKMLHSCQLKIEPIKDTACPCFIENKSQSQISNIIYSKQTEEALVH